MRQLIFEILAFVCSSNVYSQQQSIESWKNSLIQCAQIENGSYEMDFKSKGLMSQDTIYKGSSCVFKKELMDTIFGFYFDSNRRIDALTDFYSYTGSYFVSGSSEEATLFQNKESLGEVILIQHNYDFFNPLTNFERSEMSELDTSLLQFLGEERIGPYRTFHYRYFPMEDGGDEIDILKSEMNFWINKLDHVPIRYSVYYQVDLMGDTLEQYDEYSLNTYTLNDGSNYVFKTPDSFIKGGIHIKEYRKSNADSIQKLMIGSNVPNWNFETNKRIKLSSEDHFYELVLFDFYYQSCYPCLKTIPFLNKLSKKYNLKDKGLLVVGINNIDPLDDSFYEFIQRKQINYPLVISPNNLNREFKVIGYPTLFLMNKRGELIYLTEGYSEQLEVELENVIVEYLKKAKMLK